MAASIAPAEAGAHYKAPLRFSHSILSAAAPLRVVERSHGPSVSGPSRDAAVRHNSSKRIAHAATLPRRHMQAAGYVEDGAESVDITMPASAFGRLLSSFRAAEVTPAATEMLVEEAVARPWWHAPLQHVQAEKEVAVLPPSPLDAVSSIILAGPALRRDQSASSTLPQSASTGALAAAPTAPKLKLKLGMGMGGGGSASTPMAGGNGGELLVASATPRPSGEFVPGNEPPRNHNGGTSAAPTRGGRAVDVFGADEDEEAMGPVVGHGSSSAMFRPQSSSSSQRPAEGTTSGDVLVGSGFASTFCTRGRKPLLAPPDAPPLPGGALGTQAPPWSSNFMLHRWGEPRVVAGSGHLTGQVRGGRSTVQGRSEGGGGVAAASAGVVTIEDGARRSTGLPPAVADLYNVINGGSSNFASSSGSGGRGGGIAPMSWASNCLGSVEDWHTSRALMPPPTALTTRSRPAAAPTAATATGALTSSSSGSIGRGIAAVMEDLLTQCMHAVPSGSSNDILRGRFRRDVELTALVRGHAHTAEVSAETDAASAAVAVHAKVAIDKLMASLATQDMASMKLWLPGFLKAPMDFRYLQLMFPTEREHTSFSPPPAKDYAPARFLPPNPTHAGSGGATTSAGGATGVRVGSTFQVHKVEDLSCAHGPFVLFEYAEQRPPLLSACGMASTIVTYQRLEGDAVDEEVPSFSEGHNEELRLLDTGKRQALGPHDPFPMLGRLDRGQSATVLSNGLFQAPIFKHDALPTDFLLVLKQHKDSPLTAAVTFAPGAGGSGGSGAGMGSSGGGGKGKGLFGHLRAIPRIYVVGQEEPAVVVFRPGARQGKRGAALSDPDTNRFLKAFLSYQLLQMYAAVEERLRQGGDARRAKKLCGAILDASGAPKPNQLRLSDVAERFSFYFGGARKVDTLMACVGDVAEVSPDTTPPQSGERILSKKLTAPTPDDFRETAHLSVEQLCIFESQRAGDAILSATGLNKLRLAGKNVEDALRRLQTLYDAMVDRLKSTSGETGDYSSSSSGSSKSSLWEHDGGYRRLRRTLEIAQAIFYLLHTTPWAVTAK